MFEGGAGEQTGLSVLPEAVEDLVLAAGLSFRPVGQQAAQDHQQASQGPNERPSERVARPLQVQRLQDRGQPQQVAVNRIRQGAHLGWAVVAQADVVRFVQAFSPLSLPSGRAARGGDRAGSGGDGGLDSGLPPWGIGRRGGVQTKGPKAAQLARSAGDLPDLARAGSDLHEQKPGGLQNPAEAFGGLFKPLSMLGRFLQPGRLIDDHRNRGGGDHPSSQDAVGALLHR
jgi:hypothetical protein